MEQFSPLLGLSSRVMENCDGDMLIRSGKPSSGIRRQVVTGVRFWCALVMSSRVKSDDSKLCRTAFLLHTHTSGVQRVLDGITALRVTITKNRFWNTIGSLTAVTHVHSYSISLSLSPSLSLGLFLSDIPISLSSGWTVVGVSRREASLEKMAWCGSIVRIKRIPHLRWKTIRQRTTFDLTIMIAAQQTLLEEQRLHDTYTQRIW